MIKAEIQEEIFEKYIRNNGNLIPYLTFVKNSKGEILKIIISEHTIIVSD